MVNSLEGQMSEIPMHEQRNRKRRRGQITNPGNTLDGLVAKRADDIGARNSLHERYLCETEAIETPTDDQEMKGTEADPDVSSRICSICGYQGKWVSEMIRHKRVHTSERPFRCKYCSRTSKWKADLIRHVAKTHGIRVISKYSRSKAFDNSPSIQKMANESETNKLTKHCMKVFTNSSNDDASLEYKTVKSIQVAIIYQCAICFFEQDSVIVLISHLKNVHNVLPYECHSCGDSFMDSHATMRHFIENQTCTKSHLKINITSLHPAIKNNLVSKPSLTLYDEVAKRELYDLYSRNNSALYAKSLLISLSTIANAMDLIEKFLKFELKQSGIFNTFENDITKRNQAKVMIYNCTFCQWNSHEAHALEKHLFSHVKDSLFFTQRLKKFMEAKIRHDRIHTNGAAIKRGPLIPSIYFNFDAILSVLKQQIVFNPMLFLTSIATSQPSWFSNGSSLLKQIFPIYGESYQKIFGYYQEKTFQQLNSFLINNDKDKMDDGEEDDFVDVVHFDN